MRTHVHRLGAVGVFLGLAGLLTCAHVWGEPVAADVGKRPGGHEELSALKKADAPAPNVSKFAGQEVVTYRAVGKDLHFGWQLQPKLPAARKLPRDFVLLIDTSASQAKGPLNKSIQLATELIEQLGDSDRLALWTSNVTPKKLTKELQSKKDLKPAIEKLKKEYPSGASNLKKAVSEAIAAFELTRGRQRVILYLGDGMSLAEPLSGQDRASLCEQMVKKQIRFYSIPLGTRLDPVNLHALMSGTGGAPIRLDPADDKLEKLGTTVDEKLAVAVLYPREHRFSADLLDVYPTKLPPLRADQPTLVIGTVKDKGKLSCTIQGTVQGRRVPPIELTAKLAEPQLDQFFLVSMVAQWKEQKERPAILQADRALTFAYEQNHLTRGELLTQAEWALSENNYEAASKIYEQTLHLDPHSVDAKAGLSVVKQLREGKITRKQLTELIRPEVGDEVSVIGKKIRRAKVSRQQLLAFAQAQQNPGAGGNPDPVPNEIRQRQAIIDQQVREVVENQIRDANRILQDDPRGAQDLLKVMRQNVQTNPDVSAAMRGRLLGQLEDTIRSVTIQGERIQRVLDRRAEQELQVRERIDALDRRDQAQKGTVQRMRSLDQLLEKARFEVVRAGSNEDRLRAIRAANDLREDLVEQGQPVPQSVTAAYGIAQADFHFAELEELTRLREQRWLLTLLEVERRHIPFPDEPPIEFPPALRWKRLTERRKSKYESSSLGAESTDSALRRLLREMSVPRVFDELDDPTVTLELLLQSLAAKYSAPDAQPPFFLTFEINERAFAADQKADIRNFPILEKPLPKQVNVSLASYLRRILSRINASSGAVYIIRRDLDLPISYAIDPSAVPPPRYMIEITTGAFAAAEKTIRVFPVADLVIPIPNSINAQSALQQFTIFGVAGSFGIGGIGGVAGLAGLGGIGGIGGIGGLGGLGGIGGIGGLGGLGGLGGIGAGLGGLGGIGGLGGLGGIGAGLGGIGGIGGIGAGLGGAGLGGLGGIGGIGGIQGQQNLGVGGGLAGQLGQFGNLGGQFGLQGGNQSSILIQLIISVVGKPSDWVDPNALLGGLPPVPGEGLPNDNPLVDEQQANQLGYYPPALALVVKGTSRIHTRTRPPDVGGGGGLPGLGGGAGGLLGRAPGNRNDGGGRIVIGGPGNPRVEVAKGGKKPGEGIVAADFVGPKEEVDVRPEVIWEKALAKGINDPGLIVATADFLIEREKYDHAIEFLKANLRRGIVVRPWVYEALALLYRQTNASDEEIERAEVAAIDLIPQDAQGYLSASKAMAELERWDRALAFCRQAATLEPSLPEPYADALAYAEALNDADALGWAARNLLQQEWPQDSEKLHNLALAKLVAMVGAVEKKQPLVAERLREIARQQQERDLIVKLRWQGPADLDLKVIEPTASVCSARERQTVGGGIFVGDELKSTNKRFHEETYVASVAFSGKYVIEVDSVWGRPLAGKAQLQIVQHQGTAQESSRVVTVTLNGDNKVEIDLTEGRRAEAASVPPAEAKKSTAMRTSEGSRVYADLMRLADPDVQGVRRGFAGGFGSLGKTIQTLDDVKPIRIRETSKELGRTKFTNRVSPFLNNNVSLTAQATVSADRRYVRLSMNPFFSTVGKTQLQAVLPRVLP